METIESNIGVLRYGWYMCDNEISPDIYAVVAAT